jgi:hypothetical protein
MKNVVCIMLIGMSLGYLYHEGKDYKQKIQVIDDMNAFIPSYKLITNGEIHSIILIYSNYPR